MMQDTPAQPKKRRKQKPRAAYKAHRSRGPRPSILDEPKNVDSTA
ncbi:MAG: hypothetical protein AAB955_01865 [Patescibacteria group bacterium]